MCMEKQILHRLGVACLDTLGGGAHCHRTAPSLGSRRTYLLCSC